MPRDLLRTIWCYLVGDEYLPEITEAQAQENARGLSSAIVHITVADCSIRPAR